MDPMTAFPPLPLLLLPLGPEMPVPVGSHLSAQVEGLGGTLEPKPGPPHQGWAPGPKFHEHSETWMSQTKGLFWNVPH